MEYLVRSPDNNIASKEADGYDFTFSRSNKHRTRRTSYRKAQSHSILRDSLSPKSKDYPDRYGDTNMQASIGGLDRLESQATSSVFDSVRLSRADYFLEGTTSQYRRHHSQHQDENYNPYKYIRNPSEPPSTRSMNELKRTPPTVPSTVQMGNETFIIGNLLGKGGFGHVHYAYSHQRKFEVAIKIIKISNVKIEKVRHEIRINKLMNHKNIVKCYSNTEDHENIYLFLEYCANESLLRMLEIRLYLTEPEARTFLHQMCNAISYIIDQHILHCDVKLGNFYLDKTMQIKLGDFGLAIQLNPHESPPLRKSMAGTPNYLAPELIRNEHPTEKSECWALGCCLFAMIVGKPPFETSDITMTYERVKSGRYVIPESVSYDARTLIIKMLDQSPISRPSISMVARSRFASNPHVIWPMSPELIKRPPELHEHHYLQTNIWMQLPLVDTREPLASIGGLYENKQHTFTPISIHPDLEIRPQQHGSIVSLNAIMNAESTSDQYSFSNIPGNCNNAFSSLRNTHETHQEARNPTPEFGHEAYKQTLVAQYGSITPDILKQPSSYFKQQVEHVPNEQLYVGNQYYSPYSSGFAQGPNEFPILPHAPSDSLLYCHSSGNSAHCFPLESTYSNASPKYEASMGIEFSRINQINELSSEPPSAFSQPDSSCGPPRPSDLSYPQPNLIQSTVNQYLHNINSIQISTRLKKARDMMMKNITRPLHSMVIGATRSNKSHETSNGSESNRQAVYSVNSPKTPLNVNAKVFIPRYQQGTSSPNMIIESESTMEALNSKIKNASSTLSSRVARTTVSSDVQGGATNSTASSRGEVKNDQEHRGSADSGLGHENALQLAVKKNSKLRKYEVDFPLIGQSFSFPKLNDIRHLPSLHFNSFDDTEEPVGVKAAPLMQPQVPLKKFELPSPDNEQQANETQLKVFKEMRTNYEITTDAFSNEDLDYFINITSRLLRLSDRADNLSRIECEKKRDGSQPGPAKLSIVSQEGPECSIARRQSALWVSRYSYRESALFVEFSDQSECVRFGDGVVIMATPMINYPSDKCPPNHIQTNIPEMKIHFNASDRIESLHHLRTATAAKLTFIHRQNRTSDKKHYSPYRFACYWSIDDWQHRYSRNAHVERVLSAQVSLCHRLFNKLEHGERVTPEFRRVGMESQEILSQPADPKTITNSPSRYPHNIVFFSKASCKNSDINFKSSLPGFQLWETEITGRPTRATPSTALIFLAKNPELVQLETTIYEKHALTFDDNSQNPNAYHKIRIALCCPMKDGRKAPKGRNNKLAKLVIIYENKKACVFDILLPKLTEHEYEKKPQQEEDREIVRHLIANPCTSVAFRQLRDWLQWVKNHQSIKGSEAEHANENQLYARIEQCSEGALKEFDKRSLKDKDDIGACEQPILPAQASLYPPPKMSADRKERTVTIDYSGATVSPHSGSTSGVSSGNVTSTGSSVRLHSPPPQRRLRWNIDKTKQVTESDI